MFAPEGINLLKDEKALGFPHQTRALLFDLALLDVVGVAQLLLQECLEFVHPQTLHLVGGEIF